MVRSAAKKYFPNFAQNPSLTFDEGKNGKVVLTLPPLSQLVIQQGIELWQALGFEEQHLQQLPNEEGFKIVNEKADSAKSYESKIFSSRGSATLEKIYLDWWGSAREGRRKPSQPPESLKMSFMPLYNPFEYETTFPQEMGESAKSVNLVKRYFRLLLAYLKEIWNFAEGSLTPQFRKINETGDTSTWNIDMGQGGKLQGSVNFQIQFNFGPECANILGLTSNSFSWNAGENILGVNVTTLKNAVFTADQKQILDRHVFVQNEGTHPRIELTRQKMNQLVADEHRAATEAAAAAEGPETAAPAPAPAPVDPEGNAPPDAAAPEAAAPPAAADVENEPHENVENEAREEEEEEEEEGEEEANDGVEFHRFFSDHETWHNSAEADQPCSLPVDFPDNYLLLLREAEPTDFIQNKGRAAVLALVRNSSKTFPAVDIKNWGHHENLTIEIVNNSMKNYRPTSDSSSPPNDEPIYVQIDFSLIFA
jgi:hypothetical protein